jgi:hypothetical protein
MLEPTYRPVRTMARVRFCTPNIVRIAKMINPKNAKKLIVASKPSMGFLLSWEWA